MVQGSEYSKGGSVSARQGYGVNSQGEQRIQVGTGRTRVSGQGWAYRVLKWIKGIKVRT